MSTIQAKEYVDSNGVNHFREWLKQIADIRTSAVIDARLTRVRAGNIGHCRAIGLGIHELKIDFGPGYRVYFGYENRQLIVLLCGGIKKRQDQDIKFAHRLWQEFKAR